MVEHLASHVQAKMAEEAREVIRAAPLVRPHTPGGKPMRVLVSAAGSLGWVGDGAYRYDRAQRTGAPWPPLPDLWRGIATRVAGVHPWDSAILNWYEPGAALGWHRDRAESDLTLPIVTISLGDSASWAVCPERPELGSPCPGVDVESRKVSRCILETGDVTLLANETRDHWHTIERIIPAPLLSPFRTRRGRLSITIRVAG